MQSVGHFSPFKSSKIERFKHSDSISIVEENSRDKTLVFTKESIKKHAGKTPLHFFRNFNKAEPQLTTYFLTKKGLSTDTSFKKKILFSTCFFEAIFFCMKEKFA
jgi:hypothetical protein